MWMRVTLAVQQHWVWLFTQWCLQKIRRAISLGLQKMSIMAAMAVKLQIYSREMILFFSVTLWLLYNFCQQAMQVNNTTTPNRHIHVLGKYHIRHFNVLKISFQIFFQSPEDFLSFSFSIFRRKWKAPFCGGKILLASGPSRCTKNFLLVLYI